jgi:hypothetical protein
MQYIIFKSITINGKNKHQMVGTLDVSSLEVASVLVYRWRKAPWSILSIYPKISSGNKINIFSRTKKAANRATFWLREFYFFLLQAGQNCYY